MMTIFVKHYGYGSSTVHKTPLDEYVAKIADPDPYEYSGALEDLEKKVDRLSKLVGILTLLLCKQGIFVDIGAIAEQMNPNCSFIDIEVEIP